MHSGNMVFKTKPLEKQADNIELIEKAGFMLGISGSEYAKAFCLPRVKVGSDYVVKGHTVDQVYYGLGAVSRFWSSTHSNNCALTSPMRNTSNSSTTTCSFLSRKSTRVRV